MKKCKNGCRMCDYNIDNPNSQCNSYAHCQDDCPIFVHYQQGRTVDSMACGCTLVAKGQDCPYYKPTKYPMTDEEDDE